jgi:hypothetical protein
MTHTMSAVPELSWFTTRQRPPRQRLPSDGFFEHAAPHLPSASTTHPGVASEKALASLGRRQGSAAASWISMANRVPYFFIPAVKFVITVTDWLTCCEIRSSMIFLPSGESW